MSAALLEPVFVYGTLRPWRAGVPARATRFHRQIVRCVRWSEPATLSGAVLVDFGGFPGIFPGSGQVVGDLLRVTRDGLGRIDDIELPFGYQRRLATVRTARQRLDAWVYWAPPRLAGDDAGRALPDGDWLARFRGPRPGLRPPP